MSLVANSGTPRRLSCGLWVILLLSTLPAGALTVHRIGRGPELDPPGQLVEYAWTDLDPASLSAGDGISTASDTLSPVVMNPGINIAPQLLHQKRFLVWTGGIWVPARSVHTTRTERWSFWMVDGDTSTTYQDTRGLRYLLDLGEHLHLSRLHFFVPVGSNSIVPGFMIGVDDGNQQLNGLRERRVGEFDFNLVHTGQGERNVEVDLSATPVRRLLFEIVPKSLPTGFVTEGVHARGPTTDMLWEITELELYAEGFASFARYTSDVIDLGAPMSLGPLNWAGQVPGEASVEVRMRGGDDPDPNTYWRQTFRGVEQVTYDAEGRTLDRDGYENLELTEMGDISHDLANWDAWSAPVASNGEGEPTVPSPRPRRYVQFDVAFNSTPSAAGNVQYVELATSPRFVTEAIAEIDPPAAPSDREFAFRYLLLPRWEPGDPGFDLIELNTTARVAGVDAVVISSATGADTLAVGSGWQLTRLDDAGFALQLGDAIDSAEESLDLIEILFRAQVYAYGTPFQGRLRHRNFPDEVPQPVIDGNVHELADGNSTRVALSDIPHRPIQHMSVSPNAFTPNADGVNDRVRVDYEILNVEGDLPAELRVYDLSGRQLQTLLGDDNFASGHADFEWDGRDEAGRMLPPGLYVLQLLVRTDDANDREQRMVAIAY